MKIMLALLLACAGILISTFAFAMACDGCGVPTNCYSCNNCGEECDSPTSYCDTCDNCNYSTGCDNGCGTTVACDPCGDWKNQYGYGCVRPCDCDCTDNGWRYNDCVSKCELCEAFGNIGAR